MLKNARMLKIVVILLSLTGFSYATTAEATHTWSGALLECINYTLGQPLDHVPTQAELEGVTYFSCNNEDIGSISPVADLTSVEDLSLQGNFISDISPLLNLTALTTLNIYHTGVGDISVLSNLTALRTVDLTSNCITDFTPVSHVENIEGADQQSRNCGIVNSNFTDNRHNDLLWHSSSTGAVKIMQMNGITPITDISVVESSNTNLLPRGIGAFSSYHSSSFNKPDILFHNQNSGNLRI